MIVLAESLVNPSRDGPALPSLCPYGVTSDWSERVFWAAGSTASVQDQRALRLSGGVHSC
ncbi:hypothetical protein Mapa_001519 [Marchantia paleacea]|nr:hypothetical protein Mapa_001519 [Marchantia paleacea]